MRIAELRCEVTMGPAEFVVWACSLAGLSCGASAAPDVSIVQSAYEREAARGSPLHDKGLRVLKVACDDRSVETYLCQVTFMSESDPQQRLYFDIVAVVSTDRGWVLKSGLCKH
jgi:hypothetical protein